MILRQALAQLRAAQARAPSFEPTLAYWSTRQAFHRRKAQARPFHEHQLRAGLEVCTVTAAQAIEVGGYCLDRP